MSDYELDEVDSFNANREKIFLGEAGKYGKNSEGEESSDEEVMGIDEEDEDEEEEAGEDGEEEDDDEEDGEEEEEEEEEGWGGRKNYYGGEEVEDMKLMTEEAMKQQKKHLQDLAMDDFVDEELMDDWKKASEKEAANMEESAKILFASGGSSKDAAASTANLSSKEKLTLLNQQFPEFIPLLTELKTLQPILTKYQESNNNEIYDVKRIALSAYLGAISSYMAIFMDLMQNDEGFNTMKENSVMESILSSKEVWRQASELNDMDIVEDEEDEEDEDIEQGEAEGVNVEEVEEDDDDEDDEEDDEEEEEEAEEESDKSVDASDIDITVKRTNSKSKSKSKSKNINDFSETSTPHEVDLEDKTRRKKTLRFYTSRIDQASTKNSERFAGDLDLPYKERLFERQQRLIEEARKRGMEERDQLGGEDDFGDDFGANDEEQMMIANEVNQAGEDDYYETIKQKKSDKKIARKSAHEEAVQAAKDGKLAELQDAVGEDGKRAVNFQILKNKGLTPHRNKDNRNSRVKKRKKYEKAQKKLKSIRQVYDDSNRGPYDGEKTGIKKGITRSVKLV